MAKKLLTPQATLSYPHIDEPVPPMNGKGEPKYSVALVFPAGADLSMLQAAVLEAATDKWGTKAAALLKSGGLKNPFRTDGEAKGYGEGSVYFNARSTEKPGAVYLWADPATGKAMIIPDDLRKKELYAGAQVRASITAFAYDNEGKGVSFGLNNIQKLGNGPRLDGRKAADEEFEADLSMEPAPMDDVETEVTQDTV